MLGVKAIAIGICEHKGHVLLTTFAASENRSRNAGNVQKSRKKGLTTDETVIIISMFQAERPLSPAGNCAASRFIDRNSFLVVGAFCAHYFS